MLSEFEGFENRLGSDNRDKMDMLISKLRTVLNNQLIGIGVHGFRWHEFMHIYCPI